VPTSWLQLSLSAPTEALDTISNFLIERGSPGVVLEKNAVRAFFPHPNGKSLKRDVRLFYRALRTIYPAVKGKPLRWSVLKDKNWNSSWRRFFTPQKIGRNLWVTPPWLEPPRSQRRAVVTIEPGMAFGTGSHFTTRSCLEFIEEVCASLDGENCTALDVGTGSGILAIALAKMGAPKVVALDNDPVALEVARSNVRTNRVKNIVQLSDAGPARVKGSFAVVVANLVAETIIDLAQALKKRVSGNGYLILSGILKPKARDVLRHFTPAPFVLIREKAARGWVTLLLRKER